MQFKVNISVKTIKRLNSILLRTHLQTLLAFFANSRAVPMMTHTIFSEPFVVLAHMTRVLTHMTRVLAHMTRVLAQMLMLAMILSQTHQNVEVTSLELWERARATSCTDYSCISPGNCGAREYRSDIQRLSSPLPLSRPAFLSFS